MATISIIGGGRWARMIAGVICSLPGVPERVIIHSRRNEGGITAWIGEKRLEGRISVSPIWPEFLSRADAPNAVIIANRVADHFAAASAALRGGVPVLVEKPMAVTQAAVQQLCDIAAANRGTLAASNVFLFARYIDAFADVIAEHGALQNLSLVWMDGRSDIRDGETKSYDPRVSVFDDVLPHVVPIIGRLTNEDFNPTSLEVQSGGSQIDIHGRSGHVNVSLTLARNGDRRCRSIAVDARGGPFTLDFSEEPGRIFGAGQAVNGDPLWGSGLRPMGAMLTAFLENVRGGTLDERLSPVTALLSARVADIVRDSYRFHQTAWLEERIGMSPDLPLVYALQEAGLEARWSAIKNADALRSALAQSVK